MRLRNWVQLGLGAAAGIAAPTTAAMAAPIADGGFESPPPASTVPASSPGQGYQVFSVGSTFGTGGAWQVGYAPGSTGFSGDNVALSPNVEYASGNIFYNSHSGDQALDLSGTGDNNHPVGVFQSVGTTLGQLYSVSFWLASWVDQPDAKVSVYANNVLLGVAENNSNLGGRGSLPNDAAYPNYKDGNLWNQYSYTFTATGASTTLGFYNASANGVTEVGLDDIALTAVGSTGAVPEPATWAMMIVGFGAVGSVMRRRTRATVSFA